MRAPSARVLAAPRLGVFYVAMVSVAAGFSVRNLPSIAVEGWSLVFWYVAAAIVFLLPLTLTAAELASAWPHDGGVYAWVREAFGERTGFMAVWSIVVQNVPWYPTVLSFVVVSIAFGFAPDLQAHRPLVALVMIATFWLLTALCLAGPVVAATLTSFGTLLGNVVPALALIVAGALWLAGAHRIALPPFTPAALLPTFHADTLPFVSSLLLAFTGIEMSGYYALVVDRPQRNYPIAMGIALAAIAGLSIAATLAIAVVVPARAISLSGGVVQTFGVIFRALGAAWLVPVLAALTVVGALALMAAWLVGPLLGIATIARAGLLPPIFRRLNARQMPAAVMFWQAAIVTVVSVAFAFVPSINDAYWILTATVTALLGFYYLPMFAAVIRLRYTQPGVPRPFRIPGGRAGVWLVGGAGFAATALAVALALERPSTVTFVPDAVYVVLMLALALVWMIPWAVFIAIRKANWRAV